MGANDRVRVGVIGAGSWAASNHIPVLQARDDVELVVAVRKGWDALEMLKDRFGFEHITEDYREALEHDLDAVVVGSPSVFHHEHAKAAMEAGANVLCEKPVTIDPADAWDLDATAKALGRHLVISFGWHYRPTVIEAKRMMTEDGGVGDIEHILVAMASGTRELLKATGAYEGSATDFMPDWDTWTDPAMSGGGYGPAQLSHAMGLALWLSGERAKDVFALMNNVGARVDLHDAISIRYQSGATGVLSGASCPSQAGIGDIPDEPWPRHQLQVRFYGSEGQLIVDLERDFLWHFREDGVDNKPDLPDHAGLYQCDGPPSTLIDLTQGKDVPNRSPGEVGARSVEVVAAAYDSIRTGGLARVSGVS